RYSAVFHIFGSGPVSVSNRWLAALLHFALLLAVSTGLSLLTFCLTLLASIMILVIRGFVIGSRPDMTIAYRNIALPAALVALPLAFAGLLIWERMAVRRGLEPNRSQVSPRT